MPTIKAIVEYDGTEFHGFQKQPSLRTVQGELERAVGKVFRGTSPKIIGAGRTDAGVHATGQVINFAAPDWFPMDRVCLALNSVLPVDVRVKSAVPVGDDFHSRYSAKSRTYVYVVLNRTVPSALLARYTWHLSRPLEVERMRFASEVLVGTHDFASFGMPDKEGGSSIREILDIRIMRWKGAVLFIVKANAFLRGMARALVGTLVDVGRDRLEPVDVEDILNARNRQSVRVTAPPRGLYLARVEY